MPMRWLNNIGIEVVNSLLLKLLLPVTAVVVALKMEAVGFGLFNITEMPALVAILSSVLLLDFLDYWLHRLSHRINWLWRLHRVHHADPDFDVTTQMRHHPLEIAFFIPFRLLAVSLLGMPAEAAVLQSLLATVVNLFAHGNIVMPAWLDYGLRQLVITPDMHRIHHSSARTETDTNFGMVFPWWDRIFSTYLHQPARGHRGMEIGLEKFRADRDQRIDRLLVQPFVEK